MLQFVYVGVGWGVLSFQHDSRAWRVIRLKSFGSQDVVATIQADYLMSFANDAKISLTLWFQEFLGVPIGNIQLYSYVNAKHVFEYMPFVEDYRCL